MSHKKIVKTASLVIPALMTMFLIGCSNGDSVNKPSSNIVQSDLNARQYAPAEITTVYGNVVKGAVKYAEVNFYEVKDTQIASSPIESTRTDEHGRFQASLPSQSLSGVIYVEVVGAADGSSLMNCDAERCGPAAGEDAVGAYGPGESVPLSSEFRLSSAITDYRSSESVRISVTPLSHFAVQRARNTEGLSRASIQKQMGALAEVFNLPASLSYLKAVDVSDPSTWANGEVPTDDSVLYGLYSSAIARYAHIKNVSIEQAVDQLAGFLYHGESIDREVIIELLGGSLSEARRSARGNPHLQRLITEIQLVINRHKCRGVGESDPSCGPIDPVFPPEEGDDELDLVKAFVTEFRGWGRDFSLQHNSAMTNFKNRMRLVGGVWEDDIRVLASALNRVMPSIDRVFLASQEACYYCDQQDGTPFYGSDGLKTWSRGALNYRLYGSGRLDIIGAVGEVDVDLRLRLPAAEDLLETHALEITAGRVSRDNMSLVIVRGTQIALTFADALTFEGLIGERIDRTVHATRPISMSLQGEFFVDAEYGVTPGSLIDFEADLPAWLETGGWQLTEDRALSGGYSIRSEPIGDDQVSQMSAEVETLGGYLTFNYAVESEANYDFFNLYVNNQRVLSVSGFQPGFTAAQVFLPPGTHEVVWEYRKDEAVGHNQDAVWIDNIQFPALVSAGPGELVSQSILTGDITVSAYQLSEPWMVTDLNYLPGEILINGVFANDFWSSGEMGHDHIELNLAVNIANAADFVPPRPLDVNTLAQLGEYTVSDDLFTFSLPNWRIEISPAGDEGLYLYEVYQSGAQEPYESYTRMSERAQLHQVAGELIDNSGIGLNVVVPLEGLYLTTVLNASPWGTYPEGRFTANGGTVYGYLVEPAHPAETADQFVEIAMSMELGLEADGLPKLHFGGSLSRHALNEGISAFYVKLDGRRFNFVSNLWFEPMGIPGENPSVDVVSPELEITNQHGVSLLLQFEDLRDVKGLIEGKRSRRLEGDLVYNGQVYGTLKLVRGETVIEYIDGTAETFY